MDTKEILGALEQVVSARYSMNRFCIGGYQEAAVCIQSDYNGWIVYNGERGNRYGEIRCDTVLMACLEFIRKLTHHTEDVSAMEKELLQNIARVA